MALEITGKVSQILPLQSGEGKNGIWKKQYFVVEYMDGQYPKKVCVMLWGDKTDMVKNMAPGMEVKVAFNVESREYNDRWYTDVKAWRVEVGGSPSQSSTASTTPAESAPSLEEPNFQNSDSSAPENDLPF